MELPEDEIQEWDGDGARAVLVRLPDDLYARLRELSQLEEISMNSLIRRLLTNSLKETNRTSEQVKQPPETDGGSVVLNHIPIRVYINYPNPHVTVHGAPDGFYRRADGARRLVKLNKNNLGQELQLFAGGHYAFGASAGANDLWIEIDLGDFDAEVQLAKKIQAWLGQRYRPLDGAPFAIHCGA